MASVDLNSIHHYQPPHFTGRPAKDRSAACKRGPSRVRPERRSSPAHTPKITTRADLETHNLIECVDLTTSLPMETAGDLFGEPAQCFGGAEGCVQGKTPVLGIDGHSITISRFLSGWIPTHARRR